MRHLNLMWRRPFAALLLAVVLLAGSTLRVIGDGPDYIGASLNFVDGRGVAMTRGEVAALQDRFAAIGPPLAQWDVEQGTLRNRRGQREFGHFWMYSALAAPCVALAELFGLSPLAGFTALNILLYTMAWHVLARHASWRIQILLLAGPVVWWLDKAHTELFTVACLTIAAALLRTRPWWSASAAALASTQNPPLAIFALGGLVLTWWRGITLRNREVLVAATMTIALVALHPAYYLLRFGVLSPLVGFSTGRFPTFDEIGLVLWDPSLGLAGSWPVVLVAAGIALVVVVRRARPFPWLEWVIVLATLGAVLISVAQTQNPVHGGTPGLSRYALWLGPLLLPWLIDAERVGGRRVHAAFAALAALSAAIGLYAFHPARAELSHRPTALAAWLWKERPSWNDPLPAVFARSIEPHGRQMLPVANNKGCRKVLLIGQGENANIWPSVCPSAQVPERCRERGALCYGNASPDGYHFVPIPRRYWPGFTYVSK